MSDKLFSVKGKLPHAACKYDGEYQISGIFTVLSLFEIVVNYVWHRYNRIFSMLN